MLQHEEPLEDQSKKCDMHSQYNLKEQANIKNMHIKYSIGILTTALNSCNGNIALLTYRCHNANIWVVKYVHD